MGLIIQGGNTLIEGGRTRVMLNIVEDGLTLFFDPNDNRSYPDSGTSVFNIAPQATNNGITATLDASSMYVDPADGAAYFRVRSDSVVQRMDFSGTISRPADESSTVMFYFWSNYNAQGQYGNSQAFFGGKYTNYMALTGGNNGTYGVEGETDGVGTPQGNHDYFARNDDSPGFVTSAWQSWTSVFDNDQSHNYFNGKRGANTRDFLSPSTSTHSFNRLGSNSTGTSSSARGGDIRMGALLIYNRALTGEEVRQNLDILDRRFAN